MFCQDFAITPSTLPAPRQVPKPMAELLGSWRTEEPRSLSQHLPDPHVPLLERVERVLR